MLIGLSFASACIWFFGVVYKLKALVTLQNVVLIPDFREPVLKVLNASWLMAATLIACAWMSPMRLLFACAGYCVVIDEKVKAHRTALQLTWAIVVLNGMIYLLVTLILSQRHDPLLIVVVAVIAWTTIALFLAALGLACIFRVAGLMVFGMFVLFSLLGILSTASTIKHHDVNLPLIMLCLMVAATVMFSLLRKCLVGLSIKRMTKLHPQSRRDAAMAAGTKLEHPILQMKEWLPYYDFGFKRAIRRSF